MPVIKIRDDRFVGELWAGHAVDGLFCASLQQASFPAHAGEGGESVWRYGAYLDLSYADHLEGGDRTPWRGKLTTPRLNQFNPNLGMVYAAKTAPDSSPWGFELGGQTGPDTDGQVPAESRWPGYDVLRYLFRANVSYRVPAGNGFNLTTGLINSCIGYESFYAKDHPNYMRSWMADYFPYFLPGAGGQYQVDETLSLGFYLLSDYGYLAHRNKQPKYGAQAAWNFAPQWKLTQNVFLGRSKHTRLLADGVRQWTAPWSPAGIWRSRGVWRCGRSCTGTRMSA